MTDSAQSLLFGAVLAFTAVGAAPHVRAQKIPPRVVLQRYAHALTILPRPRRVSFQYSVEQLGLRNFEQTHRVYRSGPRERDETLAADGTTLTVPSVRIIENRTNRYDVLAVAPRLDAYDFTFRSRSHGMYVFETAPHAARSFTVDEVGIDARTFLPAIVRFRAADGGARGKGELRYARTGPYWMVRQAQIVARLPTGERARERIAWSTYQFPASLPPSTFQLPHSTAAPAAALQ
ncbi:MAG: hypothetical protein M3R44_00365 [Candidatus Eremiobacteraeota bacterium]|nr:hypothetical protein [Candidatus Eremiobacteraeota bacterium]